MGCCFSTPSGEDDTAPVIRAQHSSSRNITAPSTRRNSIPSPRTSHASQAAAAAGGGGGGGSILDNRPNTPLKPIPSTQRSRLPNTLAPTATTSKRVKPLTQPTTPVWTRSRLDKERGDWWDTQVTGSQEIWGAIRLAAQYLQKGELQQAQTLLDVTGCTCPTGVLWRGVYDVTGVQYKVPEWVVVEPEGVGEDIGGDGDSGVAGAGGEEEDEEGAGGEEVSVRVRTSHDQKDVSLAIRKRDLVGTIVDRLKKEAKLDSSFKVRLVYSGRVYHDYETLDAVPRWNFDQDFVLTALVSAI
ncbi:UBD domain containing protein [Pyrenophora tritici-repentis]|uniref:UBD domain containing protein n=1 Tax=Pyrenophora tritici-repentis TaxID=45151 RepID=A0A922NQQ9_9PLEO|nr:UBD domain containing protein [Pyrenophora tritici-repentis]KAI1675054.1 UBD domain containing protein [Pyrenophora tritici-repentis]KAI1687807.1 UBD domain containing protein [Pyrenophora tritici-repentis]